MILLDYAGYVLDAELDQMAPELWGVVLKAAQDHETFCSYY